jgi:hypothetical protein
VGFLLRVIEEGGEIVEEVVADLNFNPMRSGFAPTDFPMMGTLDPYGDTSFNYFQCHLLEEELQRAATRLGATGVSSEFVVEPIRLSRVARAKPQRHLVFYGD